uniref:Uncharacterized protein n=1 Tax=Arundo donax TaxID=35708 RepID=A0A0A9EMF6_ARUDO
MPRNTCIRFNIRREIDAKTRKCKCKKLKPILSIESACTGRLTVKHSKTPIRFCATRWVRVKELQWSNITLLNY